MLVLKRSLKRSGRTQQKTPFFYYCTRVGFRGNVFTEPLLRNGLHNPIVLLLRALSGNGRYLQSHRLAMGLYVTTFMVYSSYIPHGSLRLF
jgi:hypothetical protein